MKAVREYEASCACGFEGKGNGTKPATCPSCGRDW